VHRGTLVPNLGVDGVLGVDAARVSDCMVVGVRVAESQWLGARINTRNLGISERLRRKKTLTGQKLSNNRY
jgi:hypothetical protein